MDVRKVLLGLTLALLLGNGVAVADARSAGMKAYNSGDYKTAIAEWTPLAEQGDAGAQLILGNSYRFGKGVLENDKTAVMWYTKAAEQGTAEAQLMLGAMYKLGEGVLENNKKAVKWFTLAAEQGYADAQDILGQIYANGLGVPEDFSTAVKWFTLAAKQEHVDAQNTLGEMFHLNIFYADFVRAYMWYNISAYNGSKSGAENKESIAKEMTLVQINEAQDMSSRCLDSDYKDCMYGFAVDVLSLATYQAQLLIEFNKEVYVEIINGKGKTIVADLYFKDDTIDQLVTAPMQVTFGGGSGVATMMFDGRTIDVKPGSGFDTGALILGK